MLITCRPVSFLRQVTDYRLYHINVTCCWCKGVPQRQFHRRAGLATLPSVGAIPYSPHISVDYGICCVFYICVRLLYFSVTNVLYVFLQYFDTVGWVFRPVKTVTRITYTVLVET